MRWVIYRNIQIDNIYILRKQKRKDKAPNDIQSDVIEHLIKHVRDSFDAEAIHINEKITKYGYLRITP